MAMMKSMILRNTAQRIFGCSLNCRSAQRYSSSSREIEDDEKLDALADELFKTQDREKIDPSLTSVLLFPGQGSQYVGMARNLIHYPNVKEIFDCASELLGYNILDLCLYGPKTELDKTINCQPAVFVTSLAAVEKLQAESPDVLANCVAAAGFSVGEFAALVFAGAFSFEDALRLIQLRASEMQKACNDHASGMVSVVGGARTRFNSACVEAVDYCQEHLGMEEVVCKVSGYLAPNVRTIAGHRAALEYLQSHKNELFMKRVHILPVAGAFHTDLMMSAKKKLMSSIKTINIKDPIIKVHSNLDGKPYQHGQQIISKIPQQLIKPVRWEQIMHNIFTRNNQEDMPNSYELGPGKQLGSLLKKSNGKAWAKYLPVEV